MRYFSTPEVPCVAVCPSCATASSGEDWAGWSELDPELLEGARPRACARCGRALEA